jgi:predicted transcriptional regulator
LPAKQITFICLQCAIVHSDTNTFTADGLRLENQDRIERLYFELASESRLSILHELSLHDGKMRETARKLNLTTTEAFRQLQRLTDALLVQKKPEGTYAITEFGLLVLQFSTFFEFLNKHREYFATHNVRSLPYQFLNRIGELSKANFKTNVMENINAAERIAREAEKYMWGGGMEQPLNIRDALLGGISKGVKYRFLFPKRFIPKEPTIPGLAQVAEIRSMEDLPFNVAMSEKEAGISFQLIDGRVDYVSFVGTDSVFVSWVKELFLYYWEKGIRL